MFTIVNFGSLMTDVFLDWFWTVSCITMLQKHESPWNFCSRLKILGAHCVAAAMLHQKHNIFSQSCCIAHCLWLLAYFLLKSLNIASWVCNSCCSLSKMAKLPTPPSLLPACSLDQGLPGCWFFPSLCHTHQSYKNNIPTTTETWPETLSSFQLHLKGQSQVAFPSCQSLSIVFYPLVIRYRVLLAAGSFD